MNVDNTGVIDGIEYFLPHIKVYTYKQNEDIIQKVIESSDYALTASIFCEDSDRAKYLSNRFKFKAGNFYINAGCTGSVVGSQPFGGSMRSGTNDKAGGPYFPLKFLNIRTVKEKIDPEVPKILPVEQPSS